jgi:molybdopterin-guanine dinucleotide biosynthesis protein A
MNVDVIVPTLRSERLTTLFIKSFEKFKPSTSLFRYIVVENSNDDYHKQAITNISENVVWIQNPAAASFTDRKYAGSIANAHGLVVGLARAESEYVFFAHNDTCVLNEEFFSSMKEKMEEDFTIIGTVKRPLQVRAIHVSGMMVRRDFANEVDLYPKFSNDWMVLDVADSLTVECRNRNLSHFTFSNTAYDDELHEELLKTNPGLPNVAVCINEAETPIFAHLSRGTEKSHGMHQNSKKILVDEWEKNMVDVFGIA